MNEMIIQGSVFGAMADRNQWEQFSCINADGSLDSEKYAKYLCMFANHGANSTRELPFLVTDNKYQGETKQRNFLPFVWKENQQAYDLENFNQTYFDNLKKMIKIANRHNMSFQFSIFDRCHSLSMKDSPWKLNIQGLDGYYFDRVGDNTYKYARRYIEKVIETVKQAEAELKAAGVTCRLLFELENEPMKSGYVRLAVETLQLLLDSGYRKDQVEDGVFYLPYEKGKPVIKKKTAAGHGDEEDEPELVRSDLFEKLKDAKRKAGQYPKRGEKGDDKSLYFSTIHDFGASDDILQELEAALASTRRFSLSVDGEKPKPGADEWKKRLIPLFRKANKRRGPRQRIKRWKFEHLYRGDLEGNSMFDDEMEGVKGISEAHKAVFGVYPDNYEKCEPLNSVRVTHGYRGILGRDPDPEGKKGYVDFLDKGGSVVKFCKFLAGSPEFKRKSAGLSSTELAEKIYRGILGRKADKDGLKDTGKAIEGGRLAERAADMLTSPEFMKKFGQP